MEKMIRSNRFSFVYMVLSLIIAYLVSYSSQDVVMFLGVFVSILSPYVLILIFLNLKKPSENPLLDIGMSFLGLVIYIGIPYLFLLVSLSQIWRLFLFYSIVLIFFAGLSFVIHKSPFEFSYNESPRDEDFELTLWNQLILEGQGRSDKLVLNKEINNRKGLTLADIALVKSELRKWEAEKLQQVLNFIALPLDDTVLTFSVKDLGSLSKLLPKKTLASLLAAVSAYKVFEESINDFLTNFVTKIQSTLTSFDVLVALDVVVVVAVIALFIVFIVTFFRTFSGDTKRKQVKQMLPKLLKDVLEEKQSQHYHSRQFPKRWLK